MLRIGILRSAAIRRSVLPTVNLSKTSAFHTTRHFKPTSITTQRAPLSITQLPRIHARFVASSVSSQPASDDLPHAVTNAREEAKNFAQDLAKIIAGSNHDKRAHDPLADSFSDITYGIASEVPKPILYTGLAGALPYVGTAASTLWYSREAGLLARGEFASVDYDTAITLLENAAHIQVTYGAVLLSFLGALHWGLEFAGYGGQQGYKRLFLGAAPVLYAWPTLVLSPEVGLAAQWAGFTALWWADLKATNAGWTPIWYSQYRFYLSLLVGSCIIATLTGESYFNPLLDSYTLDERNRISKVQHKGMGTDSIAHTPAPANSNTPEHYYNRGRLSGTVQGAGDVDLVDGEDYYVVLHKKAPEADEKNEAKEHLESSAAEQKEKHEKLKEGKAGDVKQKHDQ